MNPKLHLLFARRSVRAYRGDHEIPPGLVGDLLEAAMAAPSACAKDPWRFLVVRERHRLATMAAGLPNGQMLPQAALAIVLCGDLQAAHNNELSYLLQDCSAAMENLLLAASALGLGACWLGVHPREERMLHLRQLLSIPETVVPVGVAALGWPAEDKPARSRFQAAHVHEETW